MVIITMDHDNDQIRIQCDGDHPDEQLTTFRQVAGLKLTTEILTTVLNFINDHSSNFSIRLERQDEGRTFTVEEW